MTKEELTKKMAESAGTTVAAAERAFGTMVASITAALQRGERVAVVGFGTFTVRISGARVGRNPKTGESIKIPAKRRAVFKAGKELKDALK